MKTDSQFVKVQTDELSAQVQTDNPFEKVQPANLADKVQTDILERSMLARRNLRVMAGSLRRSAVAGPQ